MTTYLITRHPGAVAWAARQGIQVDLLVEHLDPETIQPGDVVIGTLPVHLAARVCARGGRFRYLAVDVPAAMRGTELSADDLLRYGARLEGYRVERCD